jgi:hypothetical protein
MSGPVGVAHGGLLFCAGSGGRPGSGPVGVAHGGLLFCAGSGGRPGSGPVGVAHGGLLFCAGSGGRPGSGPVGVAHGGLLFCAGSGGRPGSGPVGVAHGGLLSRIGNEKGAKIRCGQVRLESPIPNCLSLCISGLIENLARLTATCNAVRDKASREGTLLPVGSHGFTLGTLSNTGDAGYGIRDTG